MFNKIEDVVDCNKHGKCSGLEIAINGTVLAIFCFDCWIDKLKTGGLKDYKDIVI